ncbi:hypothetical protein KPB2_5528 [Klebsiella pneumoniae Kb677]|nr:hypothetical protein KPB2_5528 [Klebsiella pneumoniae Kb677]
MTLGTTFSSLYFGFSTHSCRTPSTSYRANSAKGARRPFSLFGGLGYAASLGPYTAASYGRPVSFGSWAGSSTSSPTYATSSGRNCRHRWHSADYAPVFSNGRVGIAASSGCPAYSAYTTGPGNGQSRWRSTSNAYGYTTARANRSTSVSAPTNLTAPARSYAANLPSSNRASWPSFRTSGVCKCRNYSRGTFASRSFKSPSWCRGSAGCAATTRSEGSRYASRRTASWQAATPNSGQSRRAVRSPSPTGSTATTGPSSPRCTYRSGGY